MFTWKMRCLSKNWLMNCEKKTTKEFLSPQPELYTKPRRSKILFIVQAIKRCVGLFKITRVTTSKLGAVWMYTWIQTKKTGTFKSTLLNYMGKLIATNWLHIFVINGWIHFYVQVGMKLTSKTHTQFKKKNAKHSIVIMYRM